MIFVLVRVVAVPIAVMPLYICTLSPITASVLAKDTRIVGVASFVEPPLVNAPTTPPVTSSVTDVIEGAFGAVPSKEKLKAVTEEIFPASSCWRN